MERVEGEIAGLAQRVEKVRGGDVRDLGAIRPDADRMLATLRDLMAQENDLVFERFRDTAGLD